MWDFDSMDELIAALSKHGMTLQINPTPALGDGGITITVTADNCYATRALHVHDVAECEWVAYTLIGEAMLSLNKIINPSIFDARGA